MLSFSIWDHKGEWGYEIKSLEMKLHLATVMLLYEELDAPSNSVKSEPRLNTAISFLNGEIQEHSWDKNTGKQSKKK